MAFFPFERYDIISDLTPDEILERLIANVQTDHRYTLFSSNASGHPYHGTISLLRFNIMRVIGYRNSFMPQVLGTITPLDTQTKVHIVMRMHPAVIVFMAIWLSGALFGGAAIFFGQIMDGTFEAATPLAFSLFAFGYTLATGCFKYESNKARKFLAQLLAT